MRSLLSVGADAKTRKGQKYGYLTGILYLAPAKEAGVGNLCPHASAGCEAACLFTAGMGSFESVKQARIAKTVEFARDRANFMVALCANVEGLIKKAEKANLIPAVRLNGTSDLPWHKIPVEGHVSIMHKFSEIAFYDYTPNVSRVLDWQNGRLPNNYHLTFSRKENNQAHVEMIVAGTQANVACVFAGKTLPETYLGRRVVSGDESDLRFLDPERVIVGLSAKGKGKKDDSGFVIRA